MERNQHLHTRQDTNRLVRDGLLATPSTLSTAFVIPVSRFPVRKPTLTGASRHPANSLAEKFPHRSRNPSENAQLSASLPFSTNCSLGLSPNRSHRPGGVSFRTHQKQPWKLRLFAENKKVCAQQFTRPQEPITDTFRGLEKALRETTNSEM